MILLTYGYMTQGAGGGGTGHGSLGMRYGFGDGSIGLSGGGRGHGAYLHSYKGDGVCEDPNGLDRTPDFATLLIVNLNTQQRTQ